MEPCTKQPTQRCLIWQNECQIRDLRPRKPPETNFFENRTFKKNVNTYPGSTIKIVQQWYFNTCLIHIPIYSCRFFYPIFYLIPQLIVRVFNGKYTTLDFPAPLNIRFKFDVLALKFFSLFMKETFQKITSIPLLSLISCRICLFFLLADSLLSHKAIQKKI